MSLIKLSGNNFNQRCVVHLEDDISRCVVGSGGNGGYHAGNEPKVIVNGGGKHLIDKKENDAKYRIRKLTPKECWRLMGFKDEDFEKAQSAGISNTQLYKMAGNSIVVDVLYYIYKELYTAMPYLFDDLKVGSFFSGIGAFEKGLDRLYAEA